MGPFYRTNAKQDQLGFVRGPATILAAPITQAVPAQIGDIVKLTGSDVNEIQTLSVSGTPTGGTFTLTFKGKTTAGIIFSAAAAVIQAALEALSTIGTGNILAAGGPAPGTPVTLTFQGALAAANQPIITASSAGLTGGTTPTVSIAETTPGSGLYDPLGGWFTLGGTKNGVVPSYNNDEESFTIDQQTTAIASAPNSHDWAFQTSLVEVTPENLAFTWDMGPVTLNAVPAVPEKRMGMGTPSSYTQRRIAILHRRSKTGLIRAHFFRIMQRSPVESSMTYASTGEQQSVVLRMRALADETVSVETDTVGFILDQQG